jgi:hypothetical protein
VCIVKNGANKLKWIDLHMHVGFGSVWDGKKVLISTTY